MTKRFSWALFAILFGLIPQKPAQADLLVSSFTGNTVNRYDEVTGEFLDTFVTAGSGGLSAPHRATFGPDGRFYVASADTDQILTYDGSTGNFIGVFAASPQLDYPVDMLWDAGGSLYVTSQGNSSVVRFDGQTGAFLGTFVASGSGGLGSPSGMRFHAGSLYVSGRNSNAVYRYDATTGAFQQSFGSGALNSPFGLTVGTDNNLYVASGNRNTIVRFDPATGANLGDVFAEGSGGVSLPVGVESGPDGNLYVASFNTGSVKRYDTTTGAYLGDFVLSGSGGLSGPNFMTFSAARVVIPEPPSPYCLLLGATLLVLSKVKRRNRLA